MCRVHYNLNYCLSVCQLMHIVSRNKTLCCTRTHTVQGQEKKDSQTRIQRLALIWKLHRDCGQDGSRSSDLLVRVCAGESSWHRARLTWLGLTHYWARPLVRNPESLLQVTKPALHSRTPSQSMLAVTQACPGSHSQVMIDDSERSTAQREVAMVTRRGKGVVGRPFHSVVVKDLFYTLRSLHVAVNQLWVNAWYSIKLDQSTG